MKGDSAAGLGQFGLSHVAAFAEVVGAGSFTAAAHQLGLSKATVSKHVSYLEQHLGTCLLNRTTRSLGLTEEGARFYSHCRNILDEFATAETEILESLGVPRGRLRVSAPNFFGGQWFAPALLEFMERYPDIEIELSLHDEPSERVGEEIDVAIRVGPAPEAGAHVVRLAPCVRTVCGAPAYLLRHGEPKTPDDLRRHNCLCFGSVPRGATWCLEGPDGLQNVDVHGRFRANSGIALRNAVLSGLGLALMPESVVEEDFLSSRLVKVLPAFRDRSHALYMNYPAGRRPPPKVEAFVSFLKAYYQVVER